MTSDAEREDFPDRPMMHGTISNGSFRDSKPVEKGLRRFLWGTPSQPRVCGPNDDDISGNTRLQRAPELNQRRWTYDRNDRSPAEPVACDEGFGARWISDNAPTAYDRVKYFENSILVHRSRFVHGSHRPSKRNIFLA